MNKQPSTKFLKKITDNFGVWQHTNKGDILRSEGYALDDSARALIVFLEYGDLKEAKICLEYIEESLKDRQFIGFFNENRKSIVYPSSFDAHALAIWALAFSVSKDFETNRCKDILDKVNIDDIKDLEFLRPKAYLLIANVLLDQKTAAEELVSKIFKSYVDEINWFERRLTYANAIIPYSILLYLSKYEEAKGKYSNQIKQSIETLERNMRIGVIPAPVGNRKWHDVEDHLRDIYGQQPIDAAFMVLMYVEAYKYFKDDKYKKRAEEWMNWFYGDNIFKASLVTKEDACADGIDDTGISENFGAESTIVYLMASKYLENI